MGAVSGAGRFQWSGEALYGERHARSAPLPPLPVAPDLQPAEPSLNAPVPVADGTHAGWRWYVVKHPGMQHPLVTIQRFDGPWFSHSEEMEGVSPGKVERLIEATQARLAADSAKKRARGRR